MNRISKQQAKALFESQGWEWNDKWLGAEVKPIKRKRSVDQNARYWAIVTQLAEYSGDTKKGMHESILAEYHGDDIITLPNGKKKRIPKGRSKDLTTSDFSDLMMIAEQWAALAGVPWHDVA